MNELAVAREQIDSRVAGLRSLLMELGTTREGWVSAICHALGIPLSTLASKLQISPQAAHQLETRETDGTITLTNLRKAAEALDCKLVYALVPNRPLNQMLRFYAEQAADSLIDSVSNTMALESQSTSQKELASAREELIEQLTREPKKIWRLLK